MIRHYLGWRVYYDPSAPITGRYWAVQHGVTICTNTESGLIEMIKIKHWESHKNSLI